MDKDRKLKSIRRSPEGAEESYCPEKKEMDDYSGLEENSVAEFAKQVRDRCLEYQKENARGRYRSISKERYGSANPSSYQEVEASEVESISSMNIETSVFDDLSLEEILAYEEYRSSKKVDLNAYGDVDSEVEESIRATGIGSEFKSL